MAAAAEQMPVPTTTSQTFVLEAFFARQLIALLTPGTDEEVVFLTGPKLGSIRVVCRCAAPVALERQSAVFVRASARSVADVLIPIIEQGGELHMIAHSHPGMGPGATNPSSTDVECLGKLQSNGSQCIGCICTRSGHVRFFSVSTVFQVLLVGTGVTEVDPNVFHVPIEDQD